MDNDSKDAKRRETDSEPPVAPKDGELSKALLEAVGGTQDGRVERANEGEDGLVERIPEGESSRVERIPEGESGLVERIPEGESKGEIIGDVGITPVSRTRAELEHDIRLETVTELCRRVAQGESLRSIERDPDMPTRGTFLRWCYEDAEFGQMYTVALRLRAAGMADEVVELADKAESCTEAHEVQAIKLMVNTRQWVASRLLPKQYGDHQIVEHTGEVKLDEAQVDARLRHLIRKLKGNEK